MAFPSLERSLNKVSNRYMLVALACKRARQINRGAATRVPSRHTKPTSMALEEITPARWSTASRKKAKRRKPELATRRRAGERPRGLTTDRNRLGTLGEGAELVFLLVGV